mmetsp:Transcript_11038/g.35034  ORF Transcript_11038/g.35034 Transcript_11038/m.35034 type:complete len:168 (-) Transcript_11038:1229-1732(-)
MSDELEQASGMYEKVKDFYREVVTDVVGVKSYFSADTLVTRDGLDLLSMLDKKLIIFIGKTGAGKTSLINLLLGFIETGKTNHGKKYSQEVQDDGSVTRTDDVRSYRVKTKSAEFVVIDTPGLMDERSIVHDDGHMKKLVELLRSPSLRGYELHRFVFVFKHLDLAR